MILGKWKFDTNREWEDASEQVQVYGKKLISDAFFLELGATVWAQKKYNYFREVIKECMFINLHFKESFLY